MAYVHAFGFKPNDAIFPDNPFVLGKNRNMTT